MFYLRETQAGVTTSGRRIRYVAAVRYQSRFCQVNHHNRQPNHIIMFAKTTTLLAALSLGVAGLSAQDLSNDPAVNSNKLVVDYTADAGIATKHVFRGIKRSNEAITAGILAQFPDQKLYGGLYTVQPLDGADNSEFDVYFGITDKLNDWLNYDFGLTYYYYPNKLSAGGSDTVKQAFEPYFGLTALIPQIEGLAASGYIYFDFERTAFTFELAASYTRHLVEKLSGRLSAFTGYVDGSDFTPEVSGSDLDESYLYYGASLDLPYRLNDQVTITLGVQFSETYGAGKLGNDGSHFWGYGRVAYNF